MTQDQEPISEEEIEALRDAMRTQREELREALAEDLGGVPEDYDAKAYRNDRTGESLSDSNE